MARPALTPEARRTRRFLWVGAILVVIGLVPVVSVALSSALASAAGCTLNEVSAHPCLILGRDWGDALQSMFVMGWLMLITVPAGAFGLVVLVIGLVRLIAGRRPR